MVILLRATNCGLRLTVSPYQSAHINNNFEQTQVALGWPNRHKFYSAPQNPLLDLSKRTLDSLKSVFNIPDWSGKQSLQQTRNNGNDDINVADYLHNSCTVNDKASRLCIWYWSRLLGIFRKDLKKITNVLDEIVEKYFQTNQILYLLPSRRDIHEKKGKEF